MSNPSTGYYGTSSNAFFLFNSSNKIKYLSDIDHRCVSCVFTFLFLNPIFSDKLIISRVVKVFIRFLKDFI